MKLSKTAASMQMMYMPTRMKSTGRGGSQTGSPAIRRRSSMENTREMLHMLFRRYDIDHSGGISPDELLQLTREMGVEMTVEEVREAILQMDSSKDGVVQFDEFAAWYDSIGGTGVADGDAHILAHDMLAEQRQGDRIGIGDASVRHDQDGVHDRLNHVLHVGRAGLADAFDGA